MKAIVLVGSVLVVAVASTAVAQTAKPARARPVNFASDIAPIITASCATCHLTGVEAGRMALAPKRALASLVNVPSIEAPGLMRVVPGKPDKSYLIMKLEGNHVKNGGNGARMPFGAAPFTPERIALFRRWIKEGAKP